MAKFNIVGVQHLQGTSRKGSAYDFYVLHSVAVRPMRATEGNGNAVSTINIGTNDGIFVNGRIPLPGEVWEIEFDQNRRVDDAYPVE